MYELNAVDTSYNSPTIILKEWYDQNYTDTISEYTMVNFNAEGREVDNFFSEATNYNYADFSGAILNNANLDGCTFNYALLNGFTVNNSNLGLCIFRDNGRIVGITLNNTSLEGAEFRNNTFVKCNFINSDLSSVMFYNCDFIECSFINCEIISPKFIDCDLIDCKLTQSFFKNIFLVRTNLSGTYPSDTRSYPYALHTLEKAMIDVAKYNGHYYKVFDNPVTWNEAKSICSSYGGNLVSITNTSMNAFISGLAEGKDCWIGGYYSDDIWKWINGDIINMEPPFSSKSKFSNWDGGYAIKDNNLNAAYIGKDTGKWDAAKSSTNKGFICEWEELGKNYDVIGYTDYLYVTDQENTPDALQNWLKSLPTHTIFDFRKE